MNVKEISGVVRLASRALKMAQRIIADAEKLGLEVPRRRKRKGRGEKPAPPAKPKRQRGAGPAAAREEE